MKKIVIIGAAGVLALALGTSTLALAHFGRRTGEILKMTEFRRLFLEKKPAFLQTRTMTDIVIMGMCIIIVEII